MRSSCASTKQSVYPSLWPSDQGGSPKRAGIKAARQGAIDRNKARRISTSRIAQRTDSPLPRPRCHDTTRSGVERHRPAANSDDEAADRGSCAGRSGHRPGAGAASRRVAPGRGDGRKRWTGPGERVCRSPPASRPESVAGMPGGINRPAHVAVHSVRKSAKKPGCKIIFRHPARPACQTIALDLTKMEPIGHRMDSYPPTAAAV